MGAIIPMFCKQVSTTAAGDAIYTLVSNLARLQHQNHEKTQFQGKQICLIMTPVEYQWQFQTTIVSWYFHHISIMSFTCHVVVAQGLALASGHFSNMPNFSGPCFAATMAGSPEITKKRLLETWALESVEKRNWNRVEETGWCYSW